MRIEIPDDYLDDLSAALREAISVMSGTYCPKEMVDVLATFHLALKVLQRQTHRAAEEQRKGRANR
jgi:hypothetical protein